MNNLIGKVIVDVRSKDNEVTFFCNNADYYYEVITKDGYYWIDTVLAPLEVTEIVNNNTNIEIGATVVIAFYDKEGNPTEGELRLLRED